MKDKKLELHPLQREAFEALQRENRSCFDFHPVIVAWLVKNEYARKIEGEEDSDFGLALTDKGRAHYVRVTMLVESEKP